ncbi:MAG: DUF2344 domain-containing protein [Clostridia bacterium]|nr:DUF2344 domain-containing protein [Clostridia bacterium]
MKFLSHLELIKTVERIFRRMQLPMSFSQGFNPKPKIAYAAPLPVGVESECDFLDVELTQKIDVDAFLKNQGDYMPTGLWFVEGKYFNKTKSLMSLVTDSAYIAQIEVSEPHEKAFVEEQLKAFLSQDVITYEKKNKKNKINVIDIKPLIQEADVLFVEANRIILKVLVTTGSSGNLKPEQLVKMFADYCNFEMVPGKERYKRVDLFTRDEQNKLISLFEVK